MKKLKSKPAHNRKDYSGLKTEYLEAIELVGWIGSTLLALCAAPEVYIALKTGDSQLSYAFLAMWGGGEVFALAYTVMKNKEVSLLPLIFNYGINIVLILTLILIKTY